MKPSERVWQIAFERCLRVYGPRNDLVQLKAEDILAYLDEQVAAGNDDWIDELFERVDGWHSAGEFARTDAYLRALDVSTLDTYKVVAVLSITLPAKDKLEARGAFVERARKRLLELAPDRIEGLMQGLE